MNDQETEETQEEATTDSVKNRVIEHAPNELVRRLTPWNIAAVTALERQSRSPLDDTSIQAFLRHGVCYGYFDDLNNLTAWFAAMKLPSFNTWIIDNYCSGDMESVDLPELLHWFVETAFQKVRSSECNRMEVQIVVADDRVQFIRDLEAIGFEEISILKNYWMAPNQDAVLMSIVW